MTKSSIPLRDTVRKLLLAVALVVSCLGSSAFEVPQFVPNVVDTAGVLTSDDIAKLDATIRKLRAESHIFAAVLVVPSTQPESIEQAAEESFRKWALGQKGVDNGLLILVAVNDRKVRIEVGYGLEGSIPDVKANRIIRNVLAPNFKKQRYAGGLDEALLICNDLVLHGDSIRLKPESRFSIDSRYSTPAAIWIVLIVFVPIVVRAAAVGRASRFTSSLQPTDRERAWYRIAFLNGPSIFMTLFFLFNPGIFFVLLIPKSIWFVPLFLGFSYLFLGVANSGYLAMFKPRWREKFLSSSRNSRGAWVGVPQAFESDSGRSGGSSSSSGSFGSSSSSSSSSSSGGGSSGGGGASGSW